ncbi:MAG: hypothetical protein VXY28_08075 [Bacteroidota bacterium]|nr:hypothetical protein [Bacteroidota bacterium]
MKKLITLTVLVFYFNSSFSQGCCSGGTTNPIAGGAATGVLKQYQFELSTNHQFLSSDRFYFQSDDTIGAFDHFSSNYLFIRLDYGLSDKFTFSMASGYFLNKSKFDIEQQNTLTDTISSSGASDLIILPRYVVLNKSAENKKTEITIGLGMKLPLGSHNDSSLIYSGQLGDFYAINPFIAQTTNGSIDIIFYSFLFRSYFKQKINLFSNILHVKTGYNSLGQKFGNYTSLGLFASRKLSSNFALTLQLRAELINRMVSAQNVDLSLYNIDVNSTGSYKVFFVPQLTYNKRDLAFFITSELPVYQYVNGTQMGSKIQLTSGINYRFKIKKSNYTTEENN